MESISQNAKAIDYLINDIISPLKRLFTKLDSEKY
jgi:hypothetical protein